MKNTIGPASGLVRLTFLVQNLYAEIGRGCDLTVARCRVDDPTCGVSLPLAREIVKQVTGTQ